jgi:hypothetical protein
VELEMSEPVTPVVGAFSRLNPQEMTEAYLEIEEMWKALQQEESTELPQIAPSAAAEQ